MKPLLLTYSLQSRESASFPCMANFTTTFLQSCFLLQMLYSSTFLFNSWDQFSTREDREIQRNKRNTAKAFDWKLLLLQTFKQRVNITLSDLCIFSAHATFYWYKWAGYHSTNQLFSSWHGVLNFPTAQQNKVSILYNFYESE